MPLPPLTSPNTPVANHPRSAADGFLLADQLAHRKINFIAKDAIARAPVAAWIVREFGVVGVGRAMDHQ